MLESTTQSAVRDLFPALDQEVNGRPLVYLDNAATTQTPTPVLDVVRHYSEFCHANVHRGVHRLSQLCTDAFEEARQSISEYINAESEAEIIFTKGCTEAINLVASSWGRASLQPGDEILVSLMEHHANLVPWQLIAQEKGAVIRPIPVTSDGRLDMEGLRKSLSDRTRLVAVKHICNALGTINPVAEVAAIAKAAGAVTVVDGAQGLAHERIDVRKAGIDFYAMSSHKAYGPMGVGALYGRKELLDAMPPYQAGGDMIRVVTFEKSTFNVVPHKFEPGTPNVPGVIGFGAAIRWLSTLDLPLIARREAELAAEAAMRLEEIPGVTVLGPKSGKVGICSFLAEFAHPHDIGTVFDQFGVAIRTGHHCCMPLMTHFKVPGTARASFGVYNNKHDISVMIEAMQEVHRLFA